MRDRLDTWTDADLLSLVVDQRRDALAELYRRHGGWLLVRLRYRCSDEGLVAAFGPYGAGARSTFAVPLVVVCSFAWPRTREHLWEPSHHTRNWIALGVVGASVGGWLSRDTAARRLSV